MRTKEIGMWKIKLLLALNRHKGNGYRRVWRMLVFFFCYWLLVERVDVGRWDGERTIKGVFLKF